MLVQDIDVGGSLASLWLSHLLQRYWKRFFGFFYEPKVLSNPSCSNSRACRLSEVILGWSQGVQMEINLSEYNKWGCSVMFSAVSFLLYQWKTANSSHCVFLLAVLHFGACFFHLQLLCDIPAPFMKSTGFQYQAQQSNSLNCRFFPSLSSLKIWPNIEMSL